MNKLNAAFGAGRKKLAPEELDKKIMNTVNKWRKTGTPAYHNFRNGTKTDVEYFAHNHAKAGVQRATGWEFTKEKLKGFYDSEEDMKEEYDAEYSCTEFSQKFRGGFEQH